MKVSARIEAVSYGLQCEARYAEGEASQQGVKRRAIRSEASGVDREFGDHCVELDLLSIVGMV